jgi:hypothetical protein
MGSNHFDALGLVTREDTDSTQAVLWAQFEREIADLPERVAGLLAATMDQETCRTILRAEIEKVLARYQASIWNARGGAA